MILGFLFLLILLHFNEAHLNVVFQSLVLAAVLYELPEKIPRLLLLHALLQLDHVVAEVGHVPHRLHRVLDVLQLLPLFYS